MTDGWTERQTGKSLVESRSRHLAGTTFSNHSAGRSGFSVGLLAVQSSFFLFLSFPDMARFDLNKFPPAAKGRREKNIRWHLDNRPKQKVNQNIYQAALLRLDFWNEERKLTGTERTSMTTMMMTTTTTTTTTTVMMNPRNFWTLDTRRVLRRAEDRMSLEYLTQALALTKLTSSGSASSSPRKRRD